MIYGSGYQRANQSLQDDVQAANHHATIHRLPGTAQVADARYLPILELIQRHDVGMRSAEAMDQVGDVDVGVIDIFRRRIDY